MRNGKLPEGCCRTCRRPWKELAEKYEYWFREIDGIEYAYHTVGSGVTKGVCSGYKTQEDSDKGMQRWRSSPDFNSRGNNFEIYVAPVEANALQILQQAGLLTGPAENYTLPGKQGTWRGLLHTLEERSLCECLSKEWYAAMILTHISSLRDHIAEGIELETAVTIAIILGGIINESNIRGVIGEQTRKAGRTSKINQTIMRLVESRVRRNPKTTAKALWAELVDAGNERDEDIRIGKTRYYVNRGYIYTEDGVKNEKTIKRASLSRYFTIARRKLKHQPTRAK
ncbi:MAG: hypothetical protein Q8P12_04585 [bacterium]|nr:hypothetical protein [bacterium]